MLLLLSSSSLLSAPKVACRRLPQVVCRNKRGEKVGFQLASVSQHLQVSSTGWTSFCVLRRQVNNYVLASCKVRTFLNFGPSISLSLARFTRVFLSTTTTAVVSRDRQINPIVTQSRLERWLERVASVTRSLCTNNNGILPLFPLLS